MILDDWQEKFLKTAGDKLLCCGRQIGKSVICSMDAGAWAASHRDTVVLMIAPTERQAFSLFEKTLDYLMTNHKGLIKRGKDRPTKTKISLTNGIKIHCLPVGIAGLGIRFLTVGRLYADEASRIPEDVWTAVTPMLLTTGGDSVYLSTPAGPEGYFADAVENREEAFNSFTRFTGITSEDVIRSRKICATWTEKQREKALTHLERESKRMSKRQYAQEYMGVIVEGLRQFFKDKLIRDCMTLKRRERIIRGRKYYLGVDVARMGEDDSTFQIIDATNKDALEHVENLTTNHTLTTETTKFCLSLENQWVFKRLFIDDGGMGVAVFDGLLSDESTKRKVIAINSSSRPLDKEGKQRKKTLKEDIYNNLLMLMEQGRIRLLDDDEIFYSLKSVQFEYIDKKLKIFGNYTHIAEGLVRAAWCYKDKHLNIWIR